jgi:hypothetical protein
MAFSEQLKLAVKKRAHFACCLCHALYVEIHHIIPESEGGPDTEDNAAPLCPSCHETYGANPEKRKFIREAREFWYELCEKKLDQDQIRAAVSDALKDLATKEDIERLSVQNRAYVLGKTGEDRSADWEQTRFSFVQEEYIHPRIVQELRGWMSDQTQTVAAVDLVAANKSNRFYGAFWVRKVDQRLWVGWNDGKQEFSYSYIARSPSGVHIVECSDHGGGTGIFKSILLLAFDCDRSLDEASSGALFTRERILLKILGSIALGDRYSGTIEYRDGLLRIGPDEGWFKRGEVASKVIPIR